MSNGVILRRNNDVLEDRLSTHSVDNSTDVSSLAVKGNNAVKYLSDLDNRSADLIKNRQIMLQATKLDEKNCTTKGDCKHSSPNMLTFAD